MGKKGKERGKGGKGEEKREVKEGQKNNLLTKVGKSSLTLSI